MARSSSRRQVVFVKAKKNSLLAKARKRAASQTDKARADRERMVGEPAKATRPFIVPEAAGQSRSIWQPNISKAVVVMLVGITFIALIVYSAGKLSPNASRDSSASTDPVMVHRSAGGRNVGIDDGSGGTGLSANRALPTDESFVSTYGRLQKPNKANSETTSLNRGAALQTGNAGGSHPVSQQSSAEVQVSRGGTQVDESLFAPYDGQHKPVYLPNLSGSCDIKGAGVNAFGECLRQQLQGTAKDK